MRLSDAVAAAERSEIRSALAASRGDVRAAAKALAVPERTLWAKLKRHGISPADFRPGSPDQQ